MMSLEFIDLVDDHQDAFLDLREMVLRHSHADELGRFLAIGELFRKYFHRQCNLYMYALIIISDDCSACATLAAGLAFTYEQIALWPCYDPTRQAFVARQ